MNRSRRGVWLGALLLLGASQVGACNSSSSSDGPEAGHDASGGTSEGTGGTGSRAGSSPGTGSASPGGSSTAGEAQLPPGLDDGLGDYPVADSTPTRGGTMTFTNVGAPGFWPRRLDRSEGDPACDYKDGLDTWGGHCCMKEQHTDSTTLAPFDEEMTLIMKAISLRQLAVYQPKSEGGDAGWQLVSSWDKRDGTGQNLTVTKNQTVSTQFDGDLTHDDCVVYLSQNGSFDCGDGSDYFCPNDPGMLHLGYAGSKLIVFLASMDFDDGEVTKCDGGDGGHPGPWVAFVASELVRDGARKWNGACNCYSKTGTVGDGCGEINVFEVVMDGNDFSNREFMSTGVRSFQAGHVGGNVCGVGCNRADYADDVEVVDACAQTAYAAGPTIEVGGESGGCPVWRRPRGERYFFILLDETSRAIQVGVLHPEAIPASAKSLLPTLPVTLERTAIDALLQMRLPEGG